MLPQIKKMTIIILALALVMGPLGGNALAGNYLDEEFNSGEKIAGDMFLVRPFGLASTLLGCAFFVISLPFSALGGNVGEAGEKLVAEPARFTFTRPIGDFSSIDYRLSPHRYK